MEKTWQEIAILVVLLVLFVVGVFAVFSARNALTKQPNVTVNMDDTTYTDKNTVTVTGKETNASTLTINDQTITPASDGSFSASVSLSEGNNKVTVVAKNDGKTATVNKTVVFEQNKAVAGANTSNQGQGSNLNQAGPAEDISGMVGLTAIILSLVYYFEQKKAQRA